MLEKAIVKVQRFNRLYPTYAIEPDGIIDSVTTHYENRAKANAHGGLNINTKLYPVIEKLYK